MPLKSDLHLDTSKFDPKNISKKTLELNRQLTQIHKDCPKWYEVGIQTYRRMRENGQTPLPGLTMVEGARTLALPLARPEPPDPMPRLPAPRRVRRPALALLPHPRRRLGAGVGVRAGPVAAGARGRRGRGGGGGRVQARAGTPVAGGERGLRGRGRVPRRPWGGGVRGPVGVPWGRVGGGRISGPVRFWNCWGGGGDLGSGGLVLSYGMYNLSRDSLPHVYHFGEELVLDGVIIREYPKAYLADMPDAERRRGDVSPFFAELHKMKLPPAIFPCGTLDPLLDDSIMMSTKWAMAGADSILKLYPGAAHGFTLFAPGATETTQDALDDILEFIRERQ